MSITPTGQEGGLAKDRCTSTSYEDELSSLLPVTATGRGQHPIETGGYTLPRTRVYLCHKPARGTPTGFLYLDGEEFAVTLDATCETESELLWEDLLPRLLDYSAPVHGHTHPFCANSHEFVWAIDEHFNVALAPQWEIENRQVNQLFSQVQKKEIIEVLASAAADGSPIAPELYRNITTARPGKGDAEEVKSVCQMSASGDCQDQAGIYATNCWKCVGGFFLRHVTQYWFRETKHGDLTPGKSPLLASSRHEVAEVRAHVEAIDTFASGFGSGRPSRDTIVSGSFRGPARAGGQVVACTKDDKTIQWYLDNMSGYALHRVPLQVMEHFLRKTLLDGADPYTAPEELLRDRANIWDDMKKDFAEYGAKAHPEMEMNMTVLCAAAHIMRLPQDASLRTIALGGTTQMKSQCN